MELGDGSAANANSTATNTMTTTMTTTTINETPKNDGEFNNNNNNSNIISSNNHTNGTNGGIFLLEWRPACASTIVKANSIMSTSVGSSKKTFNILQVGVTALTSFIFGLSKQYQPFLFYYEICIYLKMKGGGNECYFDDLTSADIKFDPILLSTVSPAATTAR